MVGHTITHFPLRSLSVFSGGAAIVLRLSAGNLMCMVSEWFEGGF